MTFEVTQSYSLNIFAEWSSVHSSVHLGLHGIMGIRNRKYGIPFSFFFS